MPPPGCRVFAGFLADHGPHNIANVPALLPSYIALAAVLTDRNNELNFQREEMLQERACKLPSPLSWPNQEFCYQIHQSTDTIPFCMDYFNWFFMYQFHAYLVFFTYLHNKLIRKKPVKIAGTTKRNCVCWLMNQIAKFLIWSGEQCGDIKNCSKNWLAFISSVEWKKMLIYT